MMSCALSAEPEEQQHSKDAHAACTRARDHSALDDVEEQYPAGPTALSVTSPRLVGNPGRHSSCGRQLDECRRSCARSSMAAVARSRRIPPSCSGASSN